MPDYPAAQTGAQPVATLDAPRSDSVSHTLGAVFAAVLIAVTVSGLLMLMVFAR